MSTRLKLGLVGQPVQHSRSPQIHQHFAEQFGREIQFDLLECSPEELENTVSRFFADGGHGLNATLPHKAGVLALCQHIGEDAQLAQAANTLIPQAGGLQGENTDGRGLIRDLHRLGITIVNKRVAVIGAGGAACGIIKPLLDEQPAELAWSNRNPLKLAGKDELYQAPGILRLCANMALKASRFDLVIHASAAGHKGLVPRLPRQLFADNAVAYDLSYGPAAQPFLDWAQAKGAVATHDGLGMLIEQAALAWQHWTGELPNTDTLHETLLAQD